MSFLIKHDRVDCVVGSQDIRKIKLKSKDLEYVINSYIKPSPGVSGASNPFIKILPYQDGFKTLGDVYVDYQFPIQLIVIEFDHGDLQFQKKRALHTAELIKTPIITVYSGRRSLHMYIFFERFAKNKKEYKANCFGLLAYLAKTLPDLYKYPRTASASNPLVPDLHMFGGGYVSVRQFNGRRSGGSLQEGEVLNATNLSNISKYQINRKLPRLSNYYGSFHKTGLSYHEKNW